METFVVDFNAKMEKLQALLHQLGNQIRKARLVQAQVYQLPQISKEDTHKPLPPITPIMVSGEPARELAIQSFSHFYASPGISTKAVFRLPGVLVLDAPPYPLADIVSEINQIKDTIAELGKDHLNAAQRFRLMTHHHHGMVRLQLTRHLHIVCDPLISATYTWSARPMSYTVNGQQVVTLLKMIQSMPANERYEGHLSWQEAIEAEIGFFRLRPHHEYRIRRVLKTHPLINLRFRQLDMFTGNAVKRQFMAHTPVIYLGKKTPKLGTLKPYVPEEAYGRKKRPRRISEDPLSAFLDLYEVAPDA